MNSQAQTERSVLIALCAMMFIMLVFCAVSMTYLERKADELPGLPLVMHTITKGGSAKVVYLERWKSMDDITSCANFEIVWPAGASQGHIDYMLERSAGDIDHEYRQIGWWRDGEVFEPIIAITGKEE